MKIQMLILNNIINESKYKIIKNKNGFYLIFNKEDEIIKLNLYLKETFRKARVDAPIGFIL